MSKCTFNMCSIYNMALHAIALDFIYLKSLPFCVSQIKTVQNTTKPTVLLIYHNKYIVIVVKCVCIPHQSLHAMG